MCTCDCLCEAEDESAISSSVTFGAVAAAGSETGSGQEPSTSPTTLSFAQVVTVTESLCHVMHCYSVLYVAMCDACQHMTLVTVTE